MVKPGRNQSKLPGIAAPAKRSPGRPVARVRRGVDAQLRAQTRLGQIGPVDAGRTALARTLADLIDAEVLDPEGSRYTAGMLAGKLDPILCGLRRGDRLDGAVGDTADAELAAIIAALPD